MYMDDIQLFIIVCLIVVVPVIVLRKIINTITDKGFDIISHKINKKYNSKIEGNWQRLADRYIQTSTKVPISRTEEQKVSPQKYLQQDYRPQFAQNKLFCTNCGAQLTENAKFCPMCGTKVVHY